ncbi:hypothetical protein [Caldivirga sp. MU80]|uniref:hypothetical protein n=1 Tax=Caldivirga sp. MU80 TaxID=1650354 RepID=UPI000837973C|nr:hypothetical protein [Caldivirga sp. MU80]
MKGTIPIQTIPIMAIVLVMASHVAVAGTVATINLTNTGLNDYTLTPINNTTILFYYAPAVFGIALSLKGYYIGNCQFTPAYPPQTINTVEPELVRMPNGTLALMWLSVYGKYPNVTIVLQESRLVNGHWGSPINITHSGIVLSYSSDGEYIYIDYQAKPGLDYQSTRILVTTMSGVVLKTYNVPEVVSISAYDMNGVLLLTNGSMAFINLRNGAIEPISQNLVAGVTRNGEYYTYNPQSHILTVGGTHITIPGNYSGAYPIPFNNGYIIVAWGIVVSAFRWVNNALTPLANLTNPGNWAYLEADGVVTGNTAVIAFLNTYNMRLYVSIIPLNEASCTPSLKGAVTATAPVTAAVTTVTTTVTRIVSSATVVTKTTTVYVNTTITVPAPGTATVRASGSGVPLISVVVVVVIVAVVVFLVARRRYAWL